MNPVVHAPDGGIACAALCEAPEGDTTTTELDVTCPDCLDLVEALPTGDFTRLARHAVELRMTRSPQHDARRAHL